MKKIVLLLSLTALLSACGGEDEAAVAGCPTVNDFSIMQENDMLNVTVNGNHALYHEISVIPAGHDPNAYQPQVLDAPTQSVPAPQAGAYHVYVRAICGSGDYSTWYGPKPITINQFCAKPGNPEFLLGSLYWEYNTGFSAGANTSYFQVEYGLQGFELGTGTRATTPGMAYNDGSYYSGEIYDFYIRAYCADGVGFGDWAGPFSFVSGSNFNVCVAPGGLNATIHSYSNSTTYKYCVFNWTGYGVTTFEHTLVERNQDVNSGTITSTQSTAVQYNNLSIYTDYDFYVRGVCEDGSRTDWTMKMINP